MKVSMKLIAIIAAAILLVVLIAWMAGAFNEKIEPGTVENQSTIENGETYSLENITEITTETATGTINARDETAVSARILATIQKIHVRAGDSVKQGELLIELDDRDLQSQVAQIKQTLAAAKATLDEAQVEYERIKTLYEKKVVSRSEFDRMDTMLKSQQANYRRSQQQLKEANTALSYTSIKSPIDGKVIERYAEPGDTASPGMPLIKIYNPSLLRLDAQVRESLAVQLTIGDTINAYIDAINKKLPAIIDEIVPSADVGSRSITVKALLPTDAALYPGMFGRLLIPTGQVERIYIPTHAITRMGQLEFVEVIDDNGTLTKRYIRTGRSNDKAQVEVVSGLQAGETIFIR